MKKIFGFLGLLFLLFSVSACDDTTLIGITISSENNIRNIEVGESIQLSVQVYNSAASQEVTWTSSNDGIAIVNETGFVTGVGVGNVYIIATSVENENISQSYALIIEKASPVEIKPESITITSNNITSCKVGEKINLSASVLPKEANQAVVWSSSNESIAKVIRGVVTPMKEGSVTITATARYFAEISASIELFFEPSDDPLVTLDWEKMEYSTHQEFYESEADTPLKIKGVVTHVCPTDEDGIVNYFIQNGVDGFYVYNQNSYLFNVEVGKVYEVGGFKKNYRGLNEIVDVEYCKELTENITYTANILDNVDTSSLSAMKPYHCSIVTGVAVLESVTVNEEKAYSFYAKLDGYDVTFRVDPAYIEDFETINEILIGSIIGNEFEFTGVMTAYGYGTPSPQIQLIDADSIVFAEMSTHDILVAVSNLIEVTPSVSYSVNEIKLPTSIAGFNYINVSWASNNELIDIETGAVKHGEEDTVVKLTVTLTYDGEKYEKEFEVNVAAADNDVYEVVASLDLEDAQAPTSASYGNSPTKQGYAEAVVNLGTPKCNWMLRNALIAATGSDIYDGTLSIRARAGKSADATARIEIQEDGEYNVVDFDAAVYGNDVLGIKVKVEYSMDFGKTWVSTDAVSIDSKELTSYRFKLPEGVKRVAIVVVENSGNRVNLDNIKLMK